MTAPVRSQPDKLHYFDECTVKTVEMSGSQYCAFDLANCRDGDPIGVGFSRFMAIADLFEKMPRAASDWEERDRYADLHDHNRKLQVERTS